MDLVPAPAAPGRGGRPTLFTPTTRQTILDRLTEGLPLRVAAQLAGITYTTLNEWLHKADDPAADPAYAEFSVAVQHARSVSQQVIAGKWRNAFDTDWKAAQRYLATVYPEDWAQEQKVNVQHTGGTTVNIAVLSMDMLPGIAGLLGAPVVDTTSSDVEDIPQREDM